MNKAKKKLLLTPKATVVLVLKKHSERKEIAPKTCGYGGQIIVYPNQFF